MDKDQIEALEQALQEHPFSAWCPDDLPGATIAEVIGILYRALEARGMTEEQIKKLT